MKQTQILILLFFTIIGCCQDKSSIITEDLTLNARIIGRNACCQGEFDQLIIQLDIKNNLKQNKSFWIMKCSWEESFRTNNENISFCMRNCDSNFPIQIELESNQSITFSGALQLKLNQNQNLYSYFSSEPKSFKVGLLMLDERDFLDYNKKFNKEYKESKKTYWSNFVYLDYSNFGYKINK
jgi:hypothetical protein